MPSARPMPKKHLSTIIQALEDLQILAKKANGALLNVESDRMSAARLRTELQDIETTAYKVALDLSQMKVAQNCDGCPSAPPTSSLQAHMLVVSQELQRHAKLMRQLADHHAVGEEEPSTHCASLAAI